MLNKKNISKRNKLFLLSLSCFLLFGLMGCEENEGPEKEDYPVAGISEEENKKPEYEPIEEKPEPEREPEPLVIELCGNEAEPEDATILSDEAALHYLALVNRCYRVSETFYPSDLSVIDVESVNMHWGPHLMRESAARAAEAMFAAALEDGHVLVASSAFRTYEHQTFFFTNFVNAQGLEAAMTFSAVPGHSEHHLGLALDITTHGLDLQLSQAFTSTPEGIWVNQNAHRFGFIISFPNGREADTGFIYEPWHVRYVGVETATEIFEAQLILEEYLALNNL